METSVLDTLTDVCALGLFLVLIWGTAAFVTTILLACGEFIANFWKTRVELKKPNALPLRAFSTGEVLYTWEDWGRDAKAEHPVRYWLTETFPPFFYGRLRPLKDAWYWFKSNTFRRHHLLDLRNPSYKWGWVDVSEAILYANCNLLQKFMEVEKPWERIDWQSDDGHSEAWYEISAIYQWWTEARDEDRRKLERMYDLAGRDRKKVLEAAQFEADMQLREDKMLHRLINVRHYLWT